MVSTRKKTNKYVTVTSHASTSRLLKDLKWVPVHATSSRPSKAWDFMGHIFIQSASESCATTAPISDLLYCKFCFDEQLNSPNGLLSRVYSASANTASGNHLAHAAAKHNQTFPKTSDPKISNWLLKSKQNSPAGTQFEFNRDLTLFICRDLQPFSVVEDAGFHAFCSKNIGFELPSSATVSTTALLDIFTTVKARVIEILSSCSSGTLMMDGWTDKYKRLPYFGIRVAVIHDWQFKVLTLNISPVESHTSQNLSRHVKSVLAEMTSGHKMLLFNTTDSAANMKLLSSLLGHERVNCTAHGMHLLLTVDSLYRIPQLRELVKKCKEIVHALHFKGHLVADEVQAEADAELFQKIAKIQEQLVLDEDNPSSIPDEIASTTTSVVQDEHIKCVDSGVEQTDATPNPATSVGHIHMTLKNEVPTRWNSTLDMIESILDLRGAVDAVLKKTGNFTLCLEVDEVELLTELRKFLTPFRDFTKLVSSCSPNLSLIPLMVTKIKKNCTENVSEGDVRDAEQIKQLKHLVKANLNKRLPFTKLTKIATCFDPAVRDAALQREESEKLLLDAYRELSKSKHSALIFQRVSSEFMSTEASETAANCADNDDVKRLRLSLIDEVASDTGASQSDSVEGEITQYLALRDKSTALEFWKKHETTFPILSAMARVYLALSPGSVPVESMFSTAGLILNSKRCCLAPYRTNMVSFVHDNYPVVGL